VALRRLGPSARSLRRSPRHRRGARSPGGRLRREARGEEPGGDAAPQGSAVGGHRGVARPARRTGRDQRGAGDDGVRPESAGDDMNSVNGQQSTVNGTCLRQLLLVPWAGLVLFGAPRLRAQASPPCPQHARDCPAPPVVKVGPAPTLVPPPSDAIVLFDGKDLSKWKGPDGGPAR